MRMIPLAAPEGDRRAARAADTGQTAAVMSVDGAAQSLPADEPRRRPTEAERLAEEERERKAKAEAMDRARAHVRPGGVRYA